MDALVDPQTRARARPPATPLRLATLLLTGGAATIAGAFAFQFAGYLPCELCLKERLPFYAGIALAALTATAAWRGRRGLAAAGFAGLAVLYCGSAALGGYHAGVEWRLWPGPSDCTGTLDRAASSADFMRQLQTFRAVRCDGVAIRVLGLSLAGWNAVVSLGLAAVGLAGLLRSAR